MNEYLADTNVLIWYITGDERLPVEFRRILENSANFIWISIASLWEIVIKSSRGKLDITGSIDNFIELHIEGNKYRTLLVQPNHLQTLQNLPFHHKDPFDRMIIAQGIAEKMQILYTDTAFIPYFAE